MQYIINESKIQTLYQKMHIKQQKMNLIKAKNTVLLN